MKKSKGNLFAVILFVSIIILSGCIKVVSTSPANSQSGVNRDSVITITFDKAPNPSTLNSNTFIVKDCLGRAVAGNITSSGVTSTFTPDEPLGIHAGYSVLLTKGIKDTSGMAMSSEYSFTFTTKDGSWGAAADLNDGAGIVRYPALAVNENGGAAAIWGEYNSTFTQFAINSRFYSSGAWEPADIVDNIESFDIDIKADPSGNFFALWLNRTPSTGAVFARRHSVVSGWGGKGLLNIPTSYVWSPTLAVGAGGDALASWIQQIGDDTVIQARYFNGDTLLWSLMTTVGDNTASSIWPLKAGLDAQGNVLAAWHVYNEGVKWRRFDAAAGVWTLPAEISTYQYAGTPELAVNDALDAVITWKESDIAESKWRIKARVLGPDREWTAPVTISDPTAYAIEASSPKIQLFGGNNAQAVWTQENGYTYSSIWSCRYIDGVWENAELIYEVSNSEKFRDLKLAVDAAGNAVIIWRQEDAAGKNIRVSRYAADIGWSAPRMLSNTNINNSNAHDIEIDGKGVCSVLWTDYYGAYSSLIIRRFE
jgi:hypothetical protein